jgi:hypothetical protein
LAEAIFGINLRINWDVRVSDFPFEGVIEDGLQRRLLNGEVAVKLRKWVSKYRRLLFQSFEADRGALPVREPRYT